MMNKREITFEILNTYVDGELDAADTAEVAKAISEDTMLAREVAALTRLRSVVAESVDAPQLSVPQSPSNFGRYTAIAASIIFALVIAGSILMSALDRKPDADLLTHAWQIHHGWSIEGVTAQTRSTILLAQYAEVVPGAYVPDLSASRLSLVHVATMPLTGGQRALLAGYRGSRGCKISLLMVNLKSTLGEALSLFRDGKKEAYGWQAGSLSYVIVSDGMDSDRFQLLAKSIRQTSRQRLPFDSETRTALRKSRDKSAPCVA